MDDDSSRQLITQQIQHQGKLKNHRTDKIFQDLVSNFILQTLFLLCNPQYQSTEGIITTIVIYRGMLCKHGVRRHAMSVCVCVCPSVCLTHSYILSKQINIPSHFFTVGKPHHSSFPHQTSWQYSNQNPSNGASNANGVG